jgi:protease I
VKVQEEEEMKDKFFILPALVLIAVAGFFACGEKAEEPPLEEMAIEELDPATRLEGKKVAILIAEGFHDRETLEPKSFLEELGAEVVILGPAAGEVTAYNSDQVVTIEKAVEEVEIADFDALILPGGEGPAVLREHEPAVNFAGSFLESGKLVAAICHGSQTLITAGVVEGRRMTCVSSVAEEVREAGGLYFDEPVVVDGNLITSRVPDDLPAFNEAIRNALK